MSVTAAGERFPRSLNLVVQLFGTGHDADTSPFVPHCDIPQQEPPVGAASAGYPVLPTTAIDAQSSSATPPCSPTLDGTHTFIYDSDSDTKMSDLDLNWNEEPPAALVSIF